MNTTDFSFKHVGDPAEIIRQIISTLKTWLLDNYEYTYEYEHIEEKIEELEQLFDKQLKHLTDGKYRSQFQSHLIDLISDIECLPEFYDEDDNLNCKSEYVDNKQSFEAYFLTIAEQDKQWILCRALCWVDSATNPDSLMAQLISNYNKN